MVLDHQAEHVDDMRRLGVKGFYGDATRPDLLLAAGLAEAKVLVVAIDDAERALELVKFARRTRPDLHIVVRAFDRLAVYALFQAGANDIIREVFDSSVRAGRCALEGLGLHPYRAQKLVEAHVKFDRETHADAGGGLGPASSSLFENTEYIRRRHAAQRPARADDGRPHRPRRADRARLDPAAAAGAPGAPSGSRPAVSEWRAEASPGRRRG